MSDLTEDILLDQENQAPPERADVDALTRSAGRGAAWQLLGSGWMIAVQLGASAVLARWLRPEHYGMMGMAVLVKGFIARLGALGTRAGLIARKDVTQEDLSTAFWMEVAVSGTMFVLTFAGAPLAAVIFRTPELTWVLRAISVMFLFSAVGCVSGTILRKHLRFGTMKIIESAGFVLQSALAILFAVVFELGYWSLVFSVLLAGLGTTAASIVFARWRPSLRFGRKSFRFLFRYGIHGLGSSLTSFLHHNIDYMLVGGLLGARLLGFYEFAYRIPHMVLNRVSAPISGVLFPTLAKANTSDERLAAGYVKAAKYIAIIVFPLMGGLAAVARPAVTVLWGAKWLPVIVPLQILCFSAALRSVTAPVGTIFLCKDRPDIPFKYGLCTMVFTLGAVAGLGWAFGLIGVALGMLVSCAPSLVIMWLALRMTRTSLGKPLSALAPPAIAAAISSVLALAVSRAVESAGGAAVFALVPAVAVGAVAYFLSIKLLFPAVIADVRNTIRIVAGRKSQKRPTNTETPESTGGIQK